MLQLPDDFAVYTRQLMGEHAYKALSEALQTEAPVSIRPNPWKWKPEFISSPMDAVPWAEGATYLPTRPSFTFDPRFHAGCYYVQEASSMFLTHVLKTLVPTACTMLDLCAAPGGKSTLARSVLPKESLLVSNEIIRTRAQVLAENMIKWGDPRTVVTQNSPSDFSRMPHLFDVILADVPCSGEGMFRKDPVAVSEWSTGNVDTCWRRQRDIISDIWGCLKPGGLLIYSTCTYNALENEDNVRWIISSFGAEALEIPTDEEWGIMGDMTGSSLPVYRLMPSQVRGEGLFMAVLRKPSDETLPLKEQAFQGIMEEEIAKESRKRQKPQRTQGKGKQTTAISYDACLPWVRGHEDFHWVCTNEEVTALPKAMKSLTQLLGEYLNILHAGVPVATLKGRDWVPHHALSMSRALNTEAFPYYEVGYKEAIAYLRHESITLDGETPRGYILLTYRGIPIGFAKNVGNRGNNLYPNEWRIRSGYGPTEAVEL